jgi:hypothetical protein
MYDEFDTTSVPGNEKERLESLYKYKILDTGSDPVYNELAAAAALHFDVPVALINFVDDVRVWTKADAKGKAGNVVDRDVSLCSLAILKSEVTVFEDATQFPCLLSNPFVAGTFGLRFYAAAPIVVSQGHNVGAVCIIDFKPRKFPIESYRELEKVASSVSRILEASKGRSI